MSAGLKAMFLSERAMLLRLLIARLRDVDAAEDVMQDLWLRLESTASGPVADPIAYLYRMANNLAFDRRRSEARRSGREGAWLEVQPEGSDFPTAEDSLISRERLTAIGEAIARLPDRTAAIFRAYRFDGFSRKEIAAREQISVSAVEKHLHRAYRAVEAARAEWGVDIGQA